MAWAEKTHPEVREAAMSALMKELINNDAGFAAKKIAEPAISEFVPNAIVRDVSSGFFEQDFDAAEQWVRALPEGSVRDFAVAGTGGPLGGRFRIRLLCRKWLRKTDPAQSSQDQGQPAASIHRIHRFRPDLLIRLFIGRIRCDL